MFVLGKDLKTVIADLLAFAEGGNADVGLLAEDGFSIL